MGDELRLKSFGKGEDWVDTDRGLKLCHDCFEKLVKESDDLLIKIMAVPEKGCKRKTKSPELTK